MAAEGVTHPMTVGEAFVNQYYQILSQSPELVHRFYQDCSRLGRPNTSGTMETITLMNAINERILASDASKFRSEIQIIEAQESQNGGVVILVTGHLLLQESKRSFIQTFFLAPQEKGFFVLNDIFRYINLMESPTVDTQESYNNGLLMLMTGKDSMKKGFTQVLFLAQKEKGFFVLNDLSESIDASKLECEVKPENDFVPPEEIISGNVMEEKAKDNPSETAEKTLTVVYEVTEIERVENIPNGSGSVITPEDPPPKKTYASIVKFLKENAVPSSAFVAAPARTLFKTSVAPENQPIATPSRISETPAPEIADIQESEDVFMVYVKNLPLNATPTQLDEEFKRFGSIKPGGIQVRSSKQHGFCYGFVEFESAAAVQQAIEASPVLIGGRQTYVEEKRHSGSRANGSRQHAAPRGGFRGDGQRPRGGYNGNNRASRRPSDFEGRHSGRGSYHQQSNRSVGIPPGVSASA